MKKSRNLYESACALIPGGVNSPVRAFGSVGGTPPFIAYGKDARLTDVDNNTYIDFVCSWGPLILGHCHPRVVAAVKEAVDRGLSYGAPHAAEIELAGMICEAMPHIEKVRLVNSGTEAAMSAVRLARGVTGRDAIVKFSGCYHGHADSFLIEAGSGALTFGMPSSPGVTKGAAGDTLLAQYNDIASVEALFREHGDRIACIIVEPVGGNMGVVPPIDGFLQSLRDLTAKHKALLIFDEVITGFRLAYGGAVEQFGVSPDLTVLGKIIGGGMPVGAYGGREDLMDQVAPMGPIYQAGTLSGNPISIAAGIATLTTLRDEMPYDQLEQLSLLLSRGTAENMKEVGHPWTQNQIASMSTLFFGIEVATTFTEVKKTDTELFGRYHAGMLKEGIYLAPSAFEATFVSTAHTEADIDCALGAQRKVLRSL